MAGMIPVGEIEASGDLTTAANIDGTTSYSGAAVDRRIQMRVRPLVNEAVADNPDLVGMAGAALTTAIEGRDLVEGDDTRLLTVAGGSYAIPWVDSAGSVSGGVLLDGTVNLESAPTVGGATDVTLRPVYGSSFAWMVADSDGRVALAVQRDGSVYAPGGIVGGTAESEVGQTRSRRDAILTVGDSLTAGYFDGSPGPMLDSWPAKLQALVGDSVSVTNAAVNGYTVDEEAIRVGTFQLTVAVVGGSIPSSGPVAVTISESPGIIPGQSRSYPGTLRGIPGTLDISAAGDWSFTRTTSGSATEAPSTSPWVSQYYPNLGDTAVIMLGRNDITHKITGTEADTRTHIVEGIRRIAGGLTRQVRQVLILSIPTATTETRGTAGHSLVTSINAELERQWGNRYLDIRRWLIDNGMRKLGLTPTPADEANIAADTLPPSLMGDTVHWTRATANLVAQQVFEYMEPREWIVR